MDPIPDTRDPRPYSDVLPPPPPPRASGGDGCWKWGAIGCGMGCLSLAIFGAVMILYFVMPMMNTCMKIDSDLSALHQEMQTVAQAVNRHKDEKGSYPQTLSALVPTYVSSADSLKWSQNSQGPVFKYTRPTATGAADAPMVEYAMPYTLSDGKTAPILVRLLRSGQFAPEQIPEQCRQIRQQRGFTP